MKDAQILRMILPVALVVVLAACSAPVAVEPTPTADPTAEAPDFVPVPERELVTVYLDEFDDNSGDWLEPGDPNTIEGGELILPDIAGHSTRLIGNTPLALFPLFEVEATMEFSAENLVEVGIYCRLDPGFTQFYRVAIDPNGIRISKATPGSDVSAELFKAGSPVLDPNQSGTLALACFDEPDGFHVEAFLDGELVAQAIDTEPPPDAGAVRVSWANAPSGDGPFVFRMSSFLLETRA